jgi:hypothetical protein
VVLAAASLPIAILWDATLVVTTKISRGWAVIAALAHFGWFLPIYIWSLMLLSHDSL